MLPCPGCQRHVRAEDHTCPFCAVPLEAVSAPISGRVASVALAAGLCLLACTDSGDSAETNTVTTDPTTTAGTTDTTGESGTTTTSTTDTTTDTSTTLGDGDGDLEESAEFGGADYGGPAPCDEADTSVPLVVGSNPVDTTAAQNSFISDCGVLSGEGPDTVYHFIAPAAGDYGFNLVAPNFEGWVVEFDSYGCSPYPLAAECMPGQGVDINLGEGQYLYLALDGTAGGTATIEVTQG